VSRPVQTQEADAFAGADLETEIDHGATRTIIFGDVVDDDHGKIAR
jgi:hypothetical protein